MPRVPHGTIDQFIEHFTLAIAARAEQVLMRSAAGRSKAGAGGPRMCPNPGCTRPGAGPRNRWFCREHARSVPEREQRRMLAERKVANQTAARAARAAEGGLKLDMRCRVARCKTMSRGPRFGYMCDKHLSKLSSKEQSVARQKWNLAHAATSPGRTRTSESAETR